MITKTTTALSLLHGIAIAARHTDPDTVYASQKVGDLVPEAGWAKGRIGAVSLAVGALAHLKDGQVMDAGITNATVKDQPIGSWKVRIACTDLSLEEDDGLQEAEDLLEGHKDSAGLRAHLGEVIDALPGCVVIHPESRVGRFESPIGGAMQGPLQHGALFLCRLLHEANIATPFTTELLVAPVGGGRVAHLSIAIDRVP